MKSITKLENILENNDTLCEINSLRKKAKELRDTSNRLKTINNVIMLHGVSAPMMEAVDPNRELVKAGICCAYEELSSIPTKNEQSTIISTELSNKIKKLNKLHRKSMEGIFEKIFNSVNKKQDKIKEELEDIIEAIGVFEKIKDFDEEAFRTHKFDEYSKKSIDAIIKCFTRVWPIVRVGVIEEGCREMIRLIKSKDKNIEKHRHNVMVNIAKHFKPLVGDKQLEAILGVTISIDSKTGEFVGIKYNHLVDHETTTTVGEGGWRISDVIPYAKKTREISRLADAITIDYDDSIVTEFSGEESKLRAIVEEFKDTDNYKNMTDAFKAAKDLMNSAADMYYFQSVFERVVWLELTILKLINIAIKCEKK